MKLYYEMLIMHIEWIYQELILEILRNQKMGSFDSKIGSKYEKGVKISLIASFRAKDTIRRPSGQVKMFQGARETFRAKDGSF